MHLPPYTSFPRLTDKRVLLREVELVDISSIIEISFYNGLPAASLEEAMEMQQKINFNYQNGECIHWAIIDAVTHQIVGTCGYYRGFKESAGELGCVLLPYFRGKGYMTNAMQLAIQFGLKEMGLKRIWAATSKQNQNAQKLLHRLGFIEIGSDGDTLNYDYKS
jgi:ribosomal-protein-alanine N-acetyltransferase